jgi:ABC-type sugar transport system permease subunit
VVILSFLLAILLNAKVKGMVVFRTIYYLPMVTPIAVASVIWMWIYDRRAGVLNYLTGLVGLPPRNWLNEPRTALGAIAVMGIWLAVGGNVVIYLAALKGISQSYYEAAEIDGAGYWQKIRYITLPLLRPTTLFVVITTTMGALRAFAQMNIMTQGGPLRSTTTIVFYIFQTAFTDLRMGYAAAMSIVLFLITLVLTFINWKFLGKGVSYDAD